MGKFLSIILLSISCICYSQNQNGAIKTSNGLLLYFNLDKNTHTLNLEGDIDVSNFPFIKKNNKWFQFYTTKRNDFESNVLSTLDNYMFWEFDYLQKQYGQKLKLVRKKCKVYNSNANFWYFKNPTVFNSKIDKKVDATYFLDLIHNDMIYRFTYAAVGGDDTEAFELLVEFVKNLKFYENNINLEKLQLRVKKGKNYY